MTLSRLSSLTHIVFGLLAPIWWSVFTDLELSPGLLIICALLSLLPDIDSQSSTLGRMIPELSHEIERRVGHRTLTHSLLAIGLIALTRFVTPDWPVLTLAYASHILLDMIVGGNAGVTLLWPLRTRFAFGHIDSGSSREIALTSFAALLLFLPLVAPSMAIQARSIIPVAPTPTPTRTATPTPLPVPTLVAIDIEHVFDQASEIHVRAGDVITRGQLLADLVAHRATLAAPGLWDILPTVTPEPSATPTPYSAPTLDPLIAAAAWNDLQLAYARATLAAAPPSEDEIARECDKVQKLQSDLEKMRNNLWADQLTRDAAQSKAQEPGSTINWEQIQAMTAKLLEQERQIAEMEQTTLPDQQRSCEAIRAKEHDASPERLAVAFAEMQKAEIRYWQIMATPLPPTPEPTVSPTPLPTPTATPDVSGTWIRSAIAGTVHEIAITGVDGLAATVRIDVAVGYGQAAAPAPAGPGAGQLATVSHVADGDTIDVQFSDGSVETVRLLDVNTPETVKPNAPVECYGPEASRHTKQRLCGNDTGDNCAGIEVQVEPAERDRYGRLLGYVWLEGSLYNEELVAQGWAYYNDYGNKHQYSDQVAQAAAAAQAQALGLWAACPAP